MNTHTPGPWVVHCMSDDSPMTVPAREGNPEFQFQHWTVGDGRAGSRIARIEWYSRTWGFGSPSYEESMANFRLILSAPELLEALEALLNWSGSDDSIAGPEIASRKAARAAIAKAKGQA